MVLDESGQQGRIVAWLGGTDGNPLAVVQMDDGRQLHVPAEALHTRQDGSYLLPGTFHASGQAQQTGESVQEVLQRVPIVAEEVQIGKRQVETGRVLLTRKVVEREEVIDEPLLREEVVIERVPVNRPWAGPPPEPRYEGDRMILPLLEEVYVVEKRLMLREELHVRRVRKEGHAPQTVTLRSDEISVERVPLTEGAEEGRGHGPSATEFASGTPPRTQIP